MDNQAEVREFLQSRRARVNPADTGLITGGRRRVKGLRREEVAMLAAVSTDYYAKMERGHLAGVSPGVLDAVAVALRLDEAETAHLHDLAQAAGPPPRRRRTNPDLTIRPSLQQFLDAITGVPAFITNQTRDILACNPLGRALLSPLLDDPISQNNLARFTFFSQHAAAYFPDWEDGADAITASLRTAAGKHPHDKALTDLIGELVTRSEPFRIRWAAHNVRIHRTGTKRIHHPEVGDLEFAYEGFELPDSPGWVMFAYTATPGSATEERIKLLGSLAATQAAGSALTRPSQST